MGPNWSYGCTRFLIAHCYWSGRSHSPLSVPVDSIVVALAVTGFMTESIKFTSLPSSHPSPPQKDSFCSGLLIWINLWKGLTSAGVWCVRVCQCSEGEAGRQDLCLVVTNQLSCLWSHSPTVTGSGWGTDTFAYPDLAERWERHLRRWWLKLSQQDLSELVCLNLRDVSIPSCHFALSSDCIWVL